MNELALIAECTRNSHWGNFLIWNRRTAYMVRKTDSGKSTLKQRLTESLKPTTVSTRVDGHPINVEN